MLHEAHPNSSMEFADQLAANAVAASSVAKLVVAGNTDHLAAINEQPETVVTPEGLALENGQSLLIDRAVGKSLAFTFKKPSLHQLPFLIVFIDLGL